MLKNCRISGFADEINRDFDVQMAVLKELGQKYVELRSADGTSVADLTCETAAELGERMAAAGVSVSSVGSPIGKIMITDDFEPHFEVFRHVVELAKLWSVPNIRMFSFFMPEGEAPEKYREEVFSRIKRMVDYAAEQDVVLLHENEKEIYGDAAGRCLELMKAFYGDHFKCVFDFANFVQCGQDTMEAYEMLKPYIAYIHIKDAVKGSGEVVLPGDGDGCVKEILTMLDGAGYQGYLSLEPHLVSLDGLEKLEKRAKERKEQDGIAAYKKAYGRLAELLDE